MTTTRVNVHGHAAEGFEAVTEECRRNLNACGEPGAAFTAEDDGEQVRRPVGRRRGR